MTDKDTTNYTNADETTITGTTTHIIAATITSTDLITHIIKDRIRVHWR